MKVIRTRRRTTQWNLFFHYAATALALVSGVVLVPLYLRFIPPDLYGAWLATGNILAWLTVIDPGLSTVLQQRAAVAYGKGDVAELSALLTGGVLLSGTISLLVLVAGLISSRFLIGWLNLSTTSDIGVVEQAFTLAVVGSAFMIFSYGLTAFNQGLLSSLGIGLVYVGTMIVSMALTVILLYRGAGLLALPSGLIASGVGLTVGNAGYLVWRYASEKMRYDFSMQGAGTLAKLSTYTFLSRGVGVIASNLDAFVLTRYLGPEVVPVFVLTRKAPDMSRMFVERPAVAFMPAVSSLVGAGEMERARGVLLRLLRMILWLLGLIAGGFLVFNNDFVALWVGSKFFAGRAVNLFFVLTLVVTVVTSALSSLCFALGSIRGNSMAALAQGLVSVPLMVLGARHLGMLGAAVAPLVAMVAVSAWYYPVAFSRLLKLERADLLAMVREAAIVVVATIVAMGAFFWVTATTWPTFAFAVAAFGALYLAVLGGLSPVFRAEVIGILRSNRLTSILGKPKEIGA
jgi:O-antigen/teichoic acid export membrane protein